MGVVGVVVVGVGVAGNFVGVGNIVAGIGLGGIVLAEVVVGAGGGSRARGE